MLSMFAQQQRGVDERAFRLAHPYDWLVWEDGPWKPVASNTMVAAPSPLFAETSGPQALAIALVAKDGTEDQVTLGRGSQCDLVVNDGTLSSTHLVFMKGPAGWTVRDAGSRNGSDFEGAPMVPGHPRPLASGAALRAGSVLLRYYQPPDMLARLRGVG